MYRGKMGLLGEGCAAEDATARKGGRHNFFIF